MIQLQVSWGFAFDGLRMGCCASQGESSQITVLDRFSGMPMSTLTGPQGWSACYTPALFQEEGLAIVLYYSTRLIVSTMNIVPCYLSYEKYVHTLGKS